MSIALFDLAAPFYGWLTDNPLWHDSIREMTRHLPPSGSTLRLIDAGGGPANSARAMLALRPDLQIAALDLSAGMLRRARLKKPFKPRIHLIQADAMRLPFADSSVDAVTAHSVYYLLKDGTAFLNEAKRVLRPGGRIILLDPAQGRSPLLALRSLPRRPRAAISVVFWHAVGQAVQRVTPEGMARTLESAGFARVLGERTVEGFGVLSRGEKPYMAHLPAEARMDQVPRLSDDPIFGEDIRTLRNPFVFLLIRQTPSQPIWSLPPDVRVRWEAATAQPSVVDMPVVLAFTALPKAVAFMQPAVTENALIGVTRIAKFPKEVAAQWTFPLLLNPDYQTFRSAGRHQLTGRWIPVDSDEAITDDE